jgi:hypothetical protein
MNRKVVTFQLPLTGQISAAVDNPLYPEADRNRRYNQTQW